MVEKMINATGAFRTIKKLNSKKIIVEIGESVIYVNQTNEKLNRCGDKMSSETHYYFTSDYTLLYKKYQNADYDDFCGDRPGMIDHTMIFQLTKTPRRLTTFLRSSQEKGY